MKKLILTVLAISVLASCTKKNDNPVPNNNPSPAGVTVLHSYSGAYESHFTIAMDQVEQGASMSMLNIAITYIGDTGNSYNDMIRLYVNDTEFVCYRAIVGRQVGKTVKVSTNLFATAKPFTLRVIRESDTIAQDTVCTIKE